VANKVVVIGGGPAGLMAAGFAAANGAQVLLLEKNSMVGKKLRISGKGRCNITNAVDVADFIAHYPGNGKFLYSALHQFSNKDLLALLGQYGLTTKVERGQRVFPISDDAHQVANTLWQFTHDHGVRFRFNTQATRICVEDGHVTGVESTTGFYPADCVILATGGASYPQTGSNGDGYRLASEVGHTIVEPFPALVALRTRETWVQELSGLSLRNVRATVVSEGERQSEFGEMQFAHFGVTGPIILTLSRQVALWLRAGRQVQLFIDLKPALSVDELDQRVQRDFQKYERKQLKNALDDLLPKNLIPIVISFSGIAPEKAVHQITRAERQQLVAVLKQLPLIITSTLPLSTAIVTAGGVAVTEIDPRTMASKIVSGLYFAGEVIDVDGVTGGFNLQAAFSTGAVAGIHASRS